LNKLNEGAYRYASVQRPGRKLFLKYSIGGKVSLFLRPPREVVCMTLKFSRAESIYLCFIEAGM